MLHRGGTISNPQAREEILNLMDSIMETQFQPGLSADGQPVYAATAWRMHVTVRGKAPHLPAASTSDSRSSTHRNKTADDLRPVPARAARIVAMA